MYTARGDKKVVASAKLDLDKDQKDKCDDDGMCTVAGP